MAFTTTIDVRFGDCDPAGIAYYPRLYHFCHVAFEELWSGALGTSYAHVVNALRLGFPTVHVETNFERPVRFGDELRIEVRVVRMGRSSVDFEFAGFVEGRRAFVSTHTKVCTSIETLESRPVPDEMRASLASVAARP